MTRLTPGDIKDIGTWLSGYDLELIQKTGRSLKGIAGHALNLEEKELETPLKNVRVGVVPITSGQGIIGGFSESVCSIICHLGIQAFITSKTDVAGIAEATGQGADVILMADDERFVALNIRSGRMVDNVEATARGFVAGLDLMANGLKDKKLLVIGCGPVGRFSVRAGLERGADVAVFDINYSRCVSLKDEIEAGYKEKYIKKITIVNQFHSALQNYPLWLEATNASNIINENLITPHTYIAAPGMPLGLTPAAIKKVGDRFLHDPLQTGVAVMVIAALLCQRRNKQ